MEDRVGDVLARRAKLDSGIAPGVAISILLHAGLTAGAVWAAMHAPAPQTANVLNIKFIASSEQRVASRPPPPTTAAVCHIPLGARVMGRKRRELVRAP